MVNPFPKNAFSSIQLKKSRLIFTLFFLISFLAAECFAAASDAVNLKGTVKERNGETMPGVIVTVKNPQGQNVAYTSTNAAGSFALSYPKTLTEGTINFSCIGYQKLTIPLSRFKNDDDVTLTEEAFTLKEVTVKVPPISARGDTLTYDVNSFRNASDRSIEDVIKKLPGIKVADDGRIYYNGESINKFYIEGLDLLSGRYAMASRNISPDDVVSVNIYENHQPKKVLRDIKFSDKAALNLKLKKKSMLRPIGYVKGGTGIDADSKMPWVGELFGMLISPKTQLLLSAKGNNTGESYGNETKSLTGSDDSEKTVASGIYSDTPFGSAPIASSRYYDNRSASASVNALTHIGKNSTLNFVADYTDDCFEYGNGQSVTYATGDGENVEISEAADSEPHLREAKFGLNLENNDDGKYISDKLSFTGHFASNGYDISNDRTIGQHVKTRDYNVRNRFDGIFRVSRHVLEFKSDTRVGNTPVNRLTAVTDGRDIVSQNVKGFHIRNHEDFGYSWIINSRSHIGVRTAFDFGYDTFRSIDALPPEGKSNDVSGYKITTEIEPYYQYRSRGGVLVNLSLPLTLDNLRYDNKLDGGRYPTNRLDMNFKASINYTTPFNMKTILTVGRNSRLGDITDYIVNPVFVTFRQSNVLGSGSLNERNSLYARCNLSHRNAIEGIFSSASFMYMHTNSNRLGSLDINGDDDITTSYKSVDNKTDLFNGNISVSKKIFSWNTSFTLEGNYEHLGKDLIRQDRAVGMDMDSYNCRFGINSNPLGNYLIMDFDVSYSYSVQKIKDFGLDNHTNRTSLSFSLATHPVKALEISTHGYFNRSNVGNDTYKSSLFLDANIRYVLKSFDIELSARNLTNTRNYSYSYIKDSDIYRYTFRLRPLELLLTLKYSF